MPALDEIRSLILDSDRDSDWNQFEAGPFFTDAPDIDDDTFDQHESLWVYRLDVSLSIQWGMTARGPVGDLKTVDDLWDHVSFPDERIHVYYADVFWNGTLIDRVRVVNVDGGRGLLPLGTRTAPGYVHGQTEPVQWEYSCTRWEAGLANLLDSGHDHDRYFRDTRMTITG